MGLLSFVLCEPGGSGAEIMDLDSAYGKEYGVSLADGCTGSFSLESGSEEERAISVGAHDVKVYRNGELIGRGRIVSADRSGGDDSERTFQFVGYKQMLDRKKLWVGDTSVTTGYVGVDMAEIGWDLINISQSRAGGSGVNSFNIINSGNLTGRIVTGYKTFTEGMTLREALDDMGQTETAYPEQSFEWDIMAEGDNLVFYCWTPRRGKTPYDVATIGSGSSADYFFDNAKSVLDFSENYDFSTFANYIVCQGNAGANTLQRYDFGGPTSGSLQFRYKGVNSSTIAWNTTVSEIQAALEAMSSIGQGNVQVTSRTPTQTPSGGSIFFEFTGDLGYRSVLLSTTNDTLNPGGGSSHLITDGYRYTKQLWADDYASSPYGVIEYYHFDEKLLDTTAVDERANYLLKTMNVYTPTITFDISSDYAGKGDFWLGDYVVVDIKDSAAGYEMYRTDLRISTIHFSATDDGDESISVTVEIPQFIDRTETNLARRVAHREHLAHLRALAIARAKFRAKRALERKLAMLVKQEKTLRADKAALEKWFHSHGDKKINKGKERNRVAAYSKYIKNNRATQTKLRQQIRKLK
jgi:hypothetical protein